MTESTVAGMNQMLAGLGKVWIHLNEFRMTHGYLHVLVTTEAFKKLADVYLTDCLSIHGPTSGGPWKMRLVESDLDGEKRTVLSDENGVLEIVALRVRIE